MNNTGTKNWLLITLVFALVVTSLTLSGIVFSPWHVMPELGADGGKNIFTFLWHSLYGKGTWFTGMNYPYGEHIVYTDAQPILSVTLSRFSKYLSLEGALTAMWWFIAASYVVSIVFCFKILRRFQVVPIMAMIFAGLITVCSPQVLRISGHYALSFCAMLPALFYCTLQYHTSAKWKYPAAILLLCAFSTLLHPYFAAVAFIWMACYAVAYFITTRSSFINKTKHTAPLLLSTIAVLIGFSLFMKFTDPLAEGRPSVPFGMLQNCTHIKDIFSSGYSPFWAFIGGHTGFSKISYGGEGYTYLGISVILAVLLIAAMWLINLVAKKSTFIHTGFQPVWLVMAALALLFGMGVPFIWHMEWLLDYASAFRQFRTLGRFSWIFYYIIAIYGAVVIHALYARYIATNRRNVAYTILSLAIGIWAVEAAGYAQRTHKAVATGKDNYNAFVNKGETTWPQFLATHNYKNEDFQAILVLPFFATGSEKLWLSGNENITAWSVANGIKAGLQLQLPLVDIMMSRSNWAQTFRQVKIAGGPYVDKPVLKDLKSSKPFLLLHTDYAPLDPDQAYLLNISVPIGHYQHCAVYVCYPRVIQETDAQAAKEAFRYGLMKHDTCLNSTAPWFADHYSSGGYHATPFGTNGLAYTPGINGMLCNIPIAPARDSQQYEFSCWFRVSATDYRSPDCVVELKDSNNNIISSVLAPTKESADNELRWVLNDAGKWEMNLWLRCNVYVNLPANTRHVQCRILNFADKPCLAVDELMLRPAEATIIGRGMVNNHLLFNFRNYE